MLVNPPILPNDYRHNYIRLTFLIGTLILFFAYTVVNQLAEHGNNQLFPNTSLRAEEFSVNDIIPSDWVYRTLDALNYIWQFAWLFYSLTFIFRRTTNGYLYVYPNTLSAMFYGIYTLGFVIPTIWLLTFHENHVVWSWLVYFVSFLFLSGALFIFNHNLRLNRKIYETEGFNRDIWCLRFLVQNGLAFFACLTALRFALAFNTFLQDKFNISISNAGTITLVLAALVAFVFLFGTNFNFISFEQTAYQFSPWIVFVLFFWGVTENNWIPHHPTRNNIISLAELIITIIAALVALAIFTLRYRASKIDPLV